VLTNDNHLHHHALLMYVLPIRASLGTGGCGSLSLSSASIIIKKRRRIIKSRADYSIIENFL
jgi:hypothetical protein